MKKVVLSHRISREAIKILEGVAEVVVTPEGDADRFAELLEEATAAIVGTSIKFTAALMDGAPQLRVISRTGEGVDNIDVHAATARSILVLNTVGVNTASVAEHTVALIVGISKQLVFLDAQVRKGNFQARRLYLPVDLEGKTLGLIGYGKIGRMVAQKCLQAFNMRVIAYDPYISPADETDKIEFCETIEEVFKEADYVSIHVPLTDSTRNLVDNRLLSLMKPTAYLINTSRGGVVCEKSLAEKLRKNEIAGAAIDVFAEEPPGLENELLNCPNVILTPHTAALTKECVTKVSMAAAEGVRDYLIGKRPRSVVNPEVLPSHPLLSGDC
ncbi:D-isomer specific 2-hydroxyacid dehydrogenase,catalytic domain [Moorella glycerini]|uniref:(S)-sulfolactate dehydrogenase n=1 Tax=Neomoorella stamsii TaxID=1266720 RepID=A0A9X7P7B0_9FIRM|nr:MULTISPECIES: hydroxyacid dehydrogenase [Moorella]PRR76449.1 (S)-sulfolactate dehydrogenase [Moorella stamsii]CEP66982.1 D-isomer specific 2-hydroxyacid dehydrogenase,catalytic domain [Moorella glycerini]